jgi:hypothetical protein
MVSIASQSGNDGSEARANRVGNAAVTSRNPARRPARESNPGSVKPGGHVYFAAEPITADFPLPWGLRMDGESLWAIRGNGWMELGFNENYFREVLARTGWTAEKLLYPDLAWAAVWKARRLEDGETPALGSVIEASAATPTPPPAIWCRPRRYMLARPGPTATEALLQLHVVAHNGPNRSAADPIAIAIGDLHPRLHGSPPEAAYWSVDHKHANLRSIFSAS